jgi:charged multivesicular body protein 7
MKCLVVLAAVICTSSAIFFSSNSAAAWNGLKAGFGINPFSSTTFAALPRTVEEAQEWGWKADTSAGGCGVAGTAFNGNRYTKDSDPGAMVLFDKQGKIAGIQAGIPKTQSATYPGPQNSKYHVFNEEAKMWVVTAYFVDPSTICTTGRSQAEFETEGTGTQLSFQNGPTASSLMTIPMEESEVTTTTKFVNGRCFYGMGQHYWYQLSKTMSCDDTFPAFLLYNKGKLNGFGWAFNPNFDNSYRWEHPTRSVFGAFMQEVPDCLGVDGPVSTLHVYMTDSPSTNFC